MLHEQPAVVDHDIFVVHADDDTPFVQGELLPMLGLPAERVILSSELPFPGFTEQEIEKAVRCSRLTLAVLSPAYLRDRWAGFAELLSRNVRDDGRGGSLVPLLVADCELPAILAQHEMLDCRTPQQREASAAQLRDRLGRPDPTFEPIACPYPGMQPFSAATAAQFHGRAKEINELVGRIQAGEREIYVIGSSGSGKSSLVAAGLIPQLRDAGHRFAVHAFRPGAHPMQRLTDVVACDPTNLEGAPGRLLDREQCDRLLVFIDQFEELFTLADALERQQFVGALRVLRADRCCHLIVALRADFYGALMSSELWPDIDGRFTRLEVAALRGDALREAIEAPAREAGVYLERALIERLVSDAAAEPGALPLLQEALVLLWARRSHRLLRLESYESLGSDGRSGLAVALARRADAVLHDLTQPQQILARRIFLRLVSFGEGRPDTRRQQPRAALAGSGEDAAGTDKIIDRLIAERMLTSTTMANGEPFVREPFIDLAHETLISAWSVFQAWLRLLREDEQRRRLLEVRVTEWIKHGRTSGSWFHTIELLEAEHWIASDSARELGYSDDLPRFLAVNRATLEKAQRRKVDKMDQARFIAVSRATPEKLQRRKAGQMNRQQRESDATQEANDESEGPWRHTPQRPQRPKYIAWHTSPKLRNRPSWFSVVTFSLSSSVVLTIGLVACHQLQEVRRQHQCALHKLGLSKQEQGRNLAIERDDPIGALPHLTQAAAFGIDSVGLRTTISSLHQGIWIIRMRHNGPVQFATFSPDSARIVTASSDGTARLWDTITGLPVALPLKHENAVWSAAFSPDGTSIVTTSSDRTARLWDATTGLSLGPPLEHEKAVWSATFSPDGTSIITVSDDGIARIWNADPFNSTNYPLKCGRGIHSAEFSPDGLRVATASDDGTACLWDAPSGLPLSPPLRHSGTVWSVAFSPDSARIVTASDDGTARIWDAATGVPLGPLLKHDRPVSSATFSPDGARIVTTSTDATARLWDAATGLPSSPPLKHQGAVWSASFSPDGSRVVTASDDGTARIWDSATGDPLGSPLKHEGPVRSAEFSADGSRVVTASDDRTARLWDATTDSFIGLSFNYDDAIYNAAFSPSGARIITASDDGIARVRESSTGNPISLLLDYRGHAGALRSAAFSPDGARVVTTSHDGTVSFWDTAKGFLLSSQLNYDDAILSAAFSPDGTSIVTTSADGTARLWDAAKGRPAGPLLKHKQAVNNAAFSPDGARIVTASVDGAARIWDPATGRVGPPLMHHGPVSSAAFSPDGTRVVTASEDGTARLWDAATCNATGTPLRHSGAVRIAAFSPDGTRIVTGSEDGTARLWDVATGTLLARPLKHDSPVLSAAFSPDGTRIITSSNNGTARIWDIVETGLLSIWAEKAQSCIVEGSDTPGTALICPLSEHKPFPTELVAYARSLTAAGDRAMYSRFWTIPHAYYQKSIFLLDQKSSSASTHGSNDELRRNVSTRIAIIDAIEDNIPEARRHLEPYAPETEVLLLEKLGSFAHEHLNNDAVALELLRRAHDLDPERESILVNLAEVYFATGQYQDFAHAASKANRPTATDDERVALAALTWAVSRLTRTSDYAKGQNLLRRYREIGNDTSINWSWKGTKHALAYGRHRYEEVKPILDVLALLEKPVTDQARAQLADLLQPHKPSGSQTK